MVEIAEALRVPGGFKTYTQAYMEQEIKRHQKVARLAQKLKSIISGQDIWFGSNEGNDRVSSLEFAVEDHPDFEDSFASEDLHTVLVARSAQRETVGPNQYHRVTLASFGRVTLAGLCGNRFSVENGVTPEEGMSGGYIAGLPSVTPLFGFVESVVGQMDQQAKGAGTIHRPEPAAA